MEFVISRTIDLTNILLDLLLIIVTTGVTYFVFSVLPVKRRKAIFGKQIEDVPYAARYIIKSIESNFKETYRINDENSDGKFRYEGNITFFGGTSNFDHEYESLSKTVYLTTRSIRLERLIQLSNSLAIDDPGYLEIYLALSDLSFNAKEMFQLNEFSRPKLKTDQADDTDKEGNVIHEMKIRSVESLTASLQGSERVVDIFLAKNKTKPEESTCNNSK